MSLTTCIQCNKEFDVTIQNFSRSKFCSIKCKNIFGVEKWRISTKIKAINYKGGKCSRCGYDKCNEALEFHHRNPEEKDFGIAHKGKTRSWEKLQLELNKCDLYCANCHHELHVELKNIPE